MDVYTYVDYKAFLRGYIAHHKQKGLISQIASACGCDRTYLSQVLNAKADLTPDHMIQFCEVLGFDETQSRYLLYLLLRDRSSSLAARRKWQHKVEALKREALALTNKIFARENPGEIREELRTLYYSNWLYTAVHTLTSIAEFQTVDALAQKLHVPGTIVTRILRDLVEMNVVKREKERFVHAGGNVYISRQSPQSYAHHMNWRLRAIERSAVKEDIHYTNIFSVSANDVDKVRAQIVKLIEDQRRQVQASGAESACVFTCDFFLI